MPLFIYALRKCDARVNVQNTQKRRHAVQVNIINGSVMMNSHKRSNRNIAQKPAKLKVTQTAESEIYTSHRWRAIRINKAHHRYWHSKSGMEAKWKVATRKYLYLERKMTPNEECLPDLCCN